MQSALMWADMFIKLGLVSGCSEYCRRQSRPCGARGERARDEGRDREQERVRERGRPSGGRSELCPAVLCFSAARQSYQTPKGFVLAFVFALGLLLKYLDPRSAQTFVARWLIRHRTAPILFVKLVTLMDSFRSSTHTVFGLCVHPGEVQVADWSEGICWVDHCLRCITENIHTQETFTYRSSRD